MNRHKARSGVRKGPTKQELLRQMTGKIRRPKNPIQRPTLWQRLISGITSKKNNTTHLRKKPSTAVGGWQRLNVKQTQRVAGTIKHTEGGVMSLFKGKKMSAQEEEQFENLSIELTELKKDLRQMIKFGATKKRLMEILPQNLKEKYPYSTSALKELITNAGLSEELRYIGVHYKSDGQLVKGQQVHDFRRTPHRTYHNS